MDSCAWSCGPFHRCQRTRRQGKLGEEIRYKNCSGCGAEAPKSLAVRARACSASGLAADRDFNSAGNFLQRALAPSWVECVGMNPLPVVPLVGEPCAVNLCTESPDRAP